MRDGSDPSPPRHFRHSHPSEATGKASVSHRVTQRDSRPGNASGYPLVTVQGRRLTRGYPNM